MRIFKHLKSDWFRYGFETLAVIVGILSAFALESWNDQQKIKSEEHSILVNLLHDLQDAKKQSSALIADELDSKDHLVSALNQQASRVSLKQNLYTDSLFYYLIWSVEMETPIIISYTDIINTGKTGLITNEQIRQRFTRLELNLHNLSNLIDDRLRVQQLRIDEIAVSDLNFVRILATLNKDILTENEPENDYRNLLAEQRIRNLLALKLDLTNAIIRTRKALDDEMDSLIALLQHEIHVTGD